MGKECVRADMVRSVVPASSLPGACGSVVAVANVLVLLFLHGAGLYRAWMSAVWVAAAASGRLGGVGTVTAWSSHKQSTDRVEVAVLLGHGVVPSSSVVKYDQQHIRVCLDLTAVKL